MENNSIGIGGMEPVARPLLPMFFILDTSGSMTGQPISILNHAMEETINAVRDFAGRNSDTLLKIGVLEFNSQCRWMQPQGLEELDDFIYTRLKAGGMTHMGEALEELDSKLSRKGFLSSVTGYCMPIIIFMTDGYPNDEWEKALKHIETENKWFQHSIKIGFAIGDTADEDIMSKIVGNPEAVIQTSDLELFRRMLKIVAVKSAMIGSQSHPIGEPVSGEKIVEDIMEETGKKVREKSDNGDLGFIMPDGSDDDFWSASDTWIIDENWNDL